MDGKIVLIDGHSILNRAFYGLPDLTNASGMHTNAVYGFLNIMFKILEEEKPQYLAVAFDLKAPTFRHLMYEPYKGTRKGMPEELREQVPLMKEVLTAMEIPILTREGYEADDIIGTLAKQSEARGLEVSVISGDRDLLQLATDHIKIRIPKTKRTGTEIEDYYTKDVIDKYQVTPLQFIDLKALMGDTADNIPGLPGVGEKTATKLIVEYGSIENCKEHEAEIKPNKARLAFEEHYDLAVLSKTLAAIKIDCELDFSYDDAKLGILYTQKAYEMYKKLEFKNLLSRFGTVPEDKSSYEITTVTDFGEAEDLFEEFSKAKEIGFQIISEGTELLAAAVCTDMADIKVFLPRGFLTADYLTGRIADVLSHVERADTIGLKNQLTFLPSGKLEDRPNIFDLEIGAYLLNPLAGNYPYDDLAKEYMGELLPAPAELIGKLSLSKATDEKPEEFTKFCALWAMTALGSAENIHAKLAETGMDSLFAEIDMPLVYTLHDMEKWGVRALADELRSYGQKLEVRILELEAQIYELAGEQFNINSPKQLGVILFEKMNLPGGKKTKTGYSTAADILEKLAPEVPMVADILEYRQLTKLKSTYADGLIGYIGEDGRIHTTLNQTITATGRLSSTEPNLQNIPVRMELGRLIRKVFVPEDGFVFVDADYSQIELRVLAHMSGDEKLIGAYRQAQDIHRITASEVFHIPFDEVTPLQRRNAKAVNFGIVYGISSFGLSQDLSITRAEAKEYIDKYFETYPGIKGFLDGTVEAAKECGYTTTLYGRRRPIPELSSGNFMQRQFGERIAMNSPIQGTAADIIKIAMIRVNDRLKEASMKSRLILQIHDELLIEAAEDELDMVKAILEAEMKNAADLSVELEVDCKSGMNWYDAH